MFQSTRPRGARQHGRGQLRRAIGVSIHAPTRGATRQYADNAAEIKFQSTRPRGARQILSLMTPRQGVFQSTRPRGARRQLHSVKARYARFNPRAHAGRDVEWMEQQRKLDDVSIHAPTRGATKFLSFFLLL